MTTIGPVGAHLDAAPVQHLPQPAAPAAAPGPVAGAAAARPVDGPLQAEAANTVTRLRTLLAETLHQPDALRVAVGRLIDYLEQSVGTGPVPTAPGGVTPGVGASGGGGASGGDLPGGRDGGPPVPGGVSPGSGPVTSGGPGGGPAVPGGSQPGGGAGGSQPAGGQPGTAGGSAPGGGPDVTGGAGRGGGPGTPGTGQPGTSSPGGLLPAGAPVPGGMQPGESPFPGSARPGSTIVPGGATAPGATAPGAPGPGATGQGATVPGATVPGASTVPGGTTVPTGTTMPSGTTVPGGITVPGGTASPIGTTVPGGTTVPSGTTFPGGTTVPGGMTVPGGTQAGGGTVPGGTQAGGTGGGMDSGAGSGTGGAAGGTGVAGGGTAAQTGTGQTGTGQVGTRQGTPLTPAGPGGAAPDGEGRGTPGAPSGADRTPPGTAAGPATAQPGTPPAAGTVAAGGARPGVAAAPVPGEGRGETAVVDPRTMNPGGGQQAGGSGGLSVDPRFGLFVRERPVHPPGFATAPSRGSGGVLEELRAVLPQDGAARREAVEAAVTWVVAHVDQPQVLAARCAEFGPVLARLGVSPQQLDVLAVLLVDLLRANPPAVAVRREQEEAWVSTGRLVGRWLADGAAAAVHEPATWYAPVVAHDRRRADAAVLQVRTYLPYPCEAGQRALVDSTESGRWRETWVGNLPSAGNVVELHVVLHAGDPVGADLVERVRVGDMVRLRPVVGEPAYDAASQRPLLMVLDRDAVAPGAAALAALKAGAPRPVTVFWPAATDRDLFRLVDAAAPGTVVVRDRFSAGGDDWSGHDAYVAGPAAMVAATVAKLHAAKVPAGRVRTGSVG